jgi:hypothetical protein
MIHPFFDEDDEMEMPCVCDCGRVFDLHDGGNDPRSNKILCRKCAQKKQAIYNLERQIDNVQYDIDCGHVGKRDGKKQLKHLKAKLTEAEADDR